MQLTNDQKIFWRNDWFVHVTKQASPPKLTVAALHPVSMRYLIGYEQQNHYEGLHFVEELFARADDDSTTITSIEHESGIVTVAINNVPITLTAPNLTTEEKLITILKLTQLQLVLTVDRSPLIDKIRFEFGFAGFEPYGRDRYTCFAHPIILGDDGKDYGLEENGAEYIASSQYKHYGPDTLGTPGATDNWMHFNNEGTKWLGWRIPTAKRIRSIQFHSGGNNNYNIDFMQRVVITLWQNGRVLKTLVHTFQPVSSFAIENYTPLEVVKL